MTRLGVCCLLAGAATWTGLILAERGIGNHVAARTLDSLSTQDPETTKDAATVAGLVSASHDAREATLRLGLESGARAELLRVHEQSLAVALSSVDSAEAGALFRNSILPALGSSSDPAILGECLAWMRRWSIPAALNDRDRDALASKIAGRMLEEKRPETLDALSSLLGALADRVSPATADALTRPLARRLMAERDRSLIYGLFRGINALARSDAGTTANLLTALLAQHDPATMAVFASGLKQQMAPVRLDASSADRFALEISGRIAMERNAVAIAALESALEPLAKSAGSEASTQVCSRLVERAINEWSDKTIGALASGVAAYAPKLNTPKASDLALSIGRRMTWETSASTISALASNLGALADRADQKAIEPVAGQLVSRMRKEADPATLATLTEALAKLKQKAGATNVAEAASVLVRRMIAERDIDALTVLYSALENLDGEAREEEAEEFASQIVARIRTEPNASAILPLDLALDTFDEGVRPAKAEQFVSVLLERMQSERNPQVLRALAVGMRFFQKKTGAAKAEQAAAILTSRMTFERSAADLQLLAFGLHSFLDKAGPGVFENAAAKLAERMETEHDHTALHVLVQGLEALEPETGPASFDRAGSILMDRMFERKNPLEVGSLAASLRSIEDHVNSATREELARRLIDRMIQERDPELLRTLGEALTDVPKITLPMAQLDRLGDVFRIARAPCGVVLHVPQEALVQQIARQLMNPFCSETSWRELAGALGDLTHRPIFHQVRPGKATLDFDGLGALKEDDDEADAKTSAASVESAGLDFNQLSHALAGLRRVEGPPATVRAAQGLGTLLLLIGLGAFVAAFRASRINVSRTPPASA